MATIVVAEDDDDLRAAYVGALRAAGHEVAEAADGTAAIELSRANRPDLLLLDLHLPGADGLEVLEALRDDPAARGTRVVVLSGTSSADPRLESFALGAADYWIKGQSDDDLPARVATVLRTDSTGTCPG